MTKQTIELRNFLSLLPPGLGSVFFPLLALSLWFTSPATSTAGAYIFASEVNGESTITHPSTYTGSGGPITVRVCINPSSPNAAAMEIPVQNTVYVYNRLQATTGNLSLGNSNNIPSGQLDFESVALHEMGHCLGMAHVNAASESGLSGGDRDYTRATDGANNRFDLNPGVDGIVGSGDDSRGDDVNLHWYRRANNNPFTIDNPVDFTTYSLALEDLPSGHSFAANADRDLAALLGVPNTEAVMQQLTYYDEAQRTLAHDDVATLLYAASGIDETAGTTDDYGINLEYGGLSTTDCDISLGFTTTTSLAFCSVGGTYIGSGHVRITSANIEFSDDYAWFFNPVLSNDSDSDGDGLSDDFETNILGTDPNDVDSDGDGLADGAGGIVSLVLFPGGIDKDGDGFVDGEQDLGTNPTLVDSDNDRLPDGLEVIYGSDPLDPYSWPNLADGDLAPLGNPDGLINAADYLIGLRIVLGQLAATPLELAHSDLYPIGAPDGVIDVSDLMQLLQLMRAQP